MEDQDNLRKIEQAIRSLPDNFNILEEQIDVDVQMEYFEYTKDKDSNKDIPDLLQAEKTLNDPEIELESKKRLLVQIAAKDEVEAYRLLERYNKTAEGFLKKWSILALQESKMVLQSSLLGEKQVFISTGLGGKGKQIRYFVVLIHQKENTPFSAYQKKLVLNEFEFSIKEGQGELEELKFDEEGFASGTFLFPLKSDLQKTFRAFIDECNNFGNFLQENVILTNVKKLTINEIKEFLNKGKDNELSEN